MASAVVVVGAGCRRGCWYCRARGWRSGCVCRRCGCWLFLFFCVAAGAVVGAAVVVGVVVDVGVVVVIGAVAVPGSGCLRACCSSSWVLVVVAGKVVVVDAGCHRG